MGISITEFKHMNPKMLEMCMKGYEQRRRLEDEQWFLRFREYGIISAALGVRLGMNKGKVEYPDKPYFYEENNKKIENTNKESNEEVAVFEMKQRIRMLRESGLPESPD